ncbi:hypothetical protein BGZ76_004926, partial [Entomortierella beljakovae]
CQGYANTQDRRCKTNVKPDQYYDGIPYCDDHKATKIHFTAVINERQRLLEQGMSSQTSQLTQSSQEACVGQDSKATRKEYGHAKKEQFSQTTVVVHNPKSPYKIREGNTKSKGRKCTVERATHLVKNGAVCHKDLAVVERFYKLFPDAMKDNWISASISIEGSRFRVQVLFNPEKKHKS